MSHIHIPDGIIPFAWWVGGYIITFTIMFVLLKGIKGEEVRKKIPLTGLAAAIMLIGMSVPLGIIPVHLSLAVLTGILIGPKLGFLAVFIVNIMLALFGHGGITLVGLNTLVIGSEVLLGYFLFSLFSKKLKQLTSIILATSMALVASLTIMALLVGFSVDFNEAIPHHHAYGHGHEHDDELFEWHGIVDLEEGSHQLIFEESEDKYVNIVFLKHEDHLEEEHQHEEELAEGIIEEGVATLTKENTIVIRDKVGYKLELDETQTIYQITVDEEGEYIIFLEHHPDEFDMKLISSDGQELSFEIEDDHHHHNVSDTKYLFLTGWSALILLIAVAIAVESLGTAAIVGFFTKIRPDLVSKSNVL
ncbi:energy-coupling factor ABC transporter permease [Alkaliphilus peptidifermentans]|uniref:ABC-type Co2+ transport system, permease component n=1 Tax=Alkaliphilus peptidifermentans DSM 18978 TaxID=1120976 RepID=A0A1G5KMD4_9FIRM|nr:energy-coupling factor ABC transporter permease [Alkaliphilus peptidifermentans]SCZ01258.1 ABC-type Co2+ transport system, permease component [Alkaliphilus peptidifermentans DSM 18978]